MALERQGSEVEVLERQAREQQQLVLERVVAQRRRGQEQRPGLVGHPRLECVHLDPTLTRPFDKRNAFSGICIYVTKIN